MEHQDEMSRWKAWVTGVLGSIVGLLAMRYYWQKLAPALQDMAPANLKEPIAKMNNPTDDELPFVDAFGHHSKKDETATEAVGRIAYSSVTGEEPESEETKSMLSNQVHWAYGLMQGGMYGLRHRDAGWPDISGGVRNGVLLWLIGDEFMVPALGLQGGPKQVSPVQHANRLGAHIAYGLGTAATTQLLRRVL